MHRNQLIAAAAVVAVVAAAVAGSFIAAGTDRANPVAAGDSTSPRPDGGDPLAGVALYANPDSPVAKAARSLARTNPAGAVLLRKIASQPTGLWFGSWDPAASLAASVRATVHAAAAGGTVPLLVIYGYPFHDCGPDSSIAAAAYERWTGQAVAGIGGSAVAVVLEPDALAAYIAQRCLTPAQQRFRIGVLRDAVTQFARLPHAAVYLDAGNSGWQSARVIAGLLTSAGVHQVRGFSLNVSNFYSTPAEERYGDTVSALLHGPHYVIDTSRNGLATARTWCNPPGQALGTAPTANSGDRMVDALLWVKLPGSSDGTCNGGPPAGDFWTDYALGLAERAPRW
jgi:endoglucanase